MVKNKFIPLICLLFAIPVYSQTFEYQCRFTKTINHKAEVSESVFDIKFVEDSHTGKAVMVGNNGVAELNINQGRFKTFIEPIESGAVTTTTIFDNGTAIHYRISSLPGIDVYYSAMLYGKCLKIPSSSFN